MINNYQAKTEVFIDRKTERKVYNALSKGKLGKVNAKTVSIKPLEQDTFTIEVWHPNYVEKVEKILGNVKWEKR